MSQIALSNIPKFIRDRLEFAPDPSSKRELAIFLTELIENFFSNYSLELDQETVEKSYSDIPAWRIDTVLAKLRSLVEIQAKKKIRLYCSDLDHKSKLKAAKLLRSSGLYNFRDAIDLDLYVGIHTAISAYFKMIGLALALNPSIPIQSSTKELFKNLKFIATLPLRYLMCVDGLFWDSKQYFIPKGFSSEDSEGDVIYFISEVEIENRLKGVVADEELAGCPALRARTTLGSSVFELVETCCMESVEKFYLNWER